MYKPIINSFAEDQKIMTEWQHDISHFGDWLEYLYNEMQKIEQRVQKRQQ